MRAWAYFAVAITATSAVHAPVARGEPASEPRLEASGFIGIGWFGRDSQLGNSWAPDQVPGTAPVIGARAGWLVWPRLYASEALRLQLAIEGELAFASASTEATAIDRGGRSSYFAPVFGWRAHALVRARLASLPRIDLHAVAGGGGETVASSSPFMSKETDPVVYYGIGGSLALTERWRVRVDLRNGWMPGRVADATAIFEAHAGIAATFGGGGAPRPQPAPAPEPAPPATALEPAPEPPAAPPDPDGDGVAGAADACPDEPEDIDQFADEDGCPDPDNDGDGIEDARDACPNEPETPNGFADDDGCPDDVPADVVRALADAGALAFERGRARVTPSAERALRDTLAVLARYPELRIAVIGRPDRDARDAGDDLARRRAEAVKWHLVDQGIPADRIETAVGERAATPIELRALAK